MNNDKRNAEGYLDPTAYEALSRVRREEGPRTYRPLVFICSPYAGDVETNVCNARAYSRFAVERGYIPIAPHLLFPQFMDDSDPEERDLALFMGIALMTKCAELWAFGARVSPGMAAEIAKATARNMPIRYFDETCKEVTPI